MNALANLSDFKVKETHFDYGYDATYGLWQILVDVQHGVGWFKHEFRNLGGWLFFRNGRLHSIEGMNSLPGEVKLGLQKAGFVVPE